LWKILNGGFVPFGEVLVHELNGSQRESRPSDSAWQLPVSAHCCRLFVTKKWSTPLDLARTPNGCDFPLYTGFKTPGDYASFK
jgi:hypothetical protein